MNISTFTDVIVAVITIAIIAVLVTRPGVATVFQQMGKYLSGAIRAVLNT